MAGNSGRNIILILFIAGSLGLGGRANAGSNSTEVDTLLQQAAEMMDAQEYDKAVAVYTKIITRKEPLNPTTKMIACVKRGQAHVALGAHRAVIRDYTCAINVISAMHGLRDYKAKFHFKRGTAYDALGNLKAAIKDYTQCIEYWPDYLKCYNNRAIAYFHLGKFKKAIADASAYLAQDPNRATLYCARGVAKMQLGNPAGFQDIVKAASMGSKACQEALGEAGF